MKAFQSRRQDLGENMTIFIKENPKQDLPVFARNSLHNTTSLKERQVVVAHTYNPSYVGGRDRRTAV
jgi:hypothetical protein